MKDNTLAVQQGEIYVRLNILNISRKRFNYTSVSKDLRDRFKFFSKYKFDSRDRRQLSMLHKT